MISRRMVEPPASAGGFIPARSPTHDRTELDSFLGKFSTHKLVLAILNESN